ncbi:MAG TPA: hypothetical protein VMB73_25295 [Acetobacteraceae bacterium]|nr:hypothetical protein [Acetobacteraceae bacterium]
MLTTRAIGRTLYSVAFRAEMGQSSSDLIRHGEPALERHSPKPLEFANSKS